MDFTGKTEISTYLLLLVKDHNRGLLYKLKESVEGFAFESAVHNNGRNVLLLSQE